MTKKVLVVDLDGTLYSINTFHHFIKFILIEVFSKLNFSLCLKILSLLVLRVLGIMSHAYMKYQLLKLVSTNYHDLNCRAFTERIEKHQNSIPEIQEPYDLKILATAAPDCYAKIIAANNGFNACIATKFSTAGFNSDFENIREYKKNNVINYLNRNGFQNIDMLITDHIDDLSLLKIASKSILINPSKTFEKIVRTHNIQYEIMRL